jgi:hypothetical protein
LGKPHHKSVVALACDRRRTYIAVMGKRKLGVPATLALVVPLLAILAAALWYAASAFVSLGGAPMPTSGYVAMILGVVFSLVIGFGLMGLLFYSSRHGYDEPERADGDGE